MVVLAVERQGLERLEQDRKVVLAVLEQIPSTLGAVVAQIRRVVMALEQAALVQQQVVMGVTAYKAALPEQLYITQVGEAAVSIRQAQRVVQVV